MPYQFQYCGGRVHVAYRTHHVLALCQSLCKATAHDNQLTVEIDGIVPSAEKDTHNKNSISVGYHAKEDYLWGGVPTWLVYPLQSFAQQLLLSYLDSPIAGGKGVWAS